MDGRRAHTDAGGIILLSQDDKEKKPSTPQEQDNGIKELIPGGSWRFE